MEEATTAPDRHQLNRSAGLALLLALSTLVAALAMAVAIASMIDDLTGDRTVAVRIPAEEVELSVSGTDLAIEEVAGTVEASRGTHLVSSVGTAVEAGAAAVIAGALALLVWNARQGDPFGRANLTRLRVAVAAAIVGLAGTVVASFGHLMATDDAGLTPMTELTFAWPAAILVFAVLAQVWSVGVALRDDAELTI